MDKIEVVFMLLLNTVKLGNMKQCVEELPGELWAICWIRGEQTLVL